MNTLKIFLLAVIYTSVFYSCNDEIENPSVTWPPTQPPIEKIEGRFLLAKSAVFRNNNYNKVELDVHLEGPGEMNVFGSAKLIMDHQEVIEVMENRVNMNGGEFILRNENGTELYGQYSGATNNLNQKLNLHAVINSGKGDFENAYGSITIELVPQGNSEYLAWVSGTVYLSDNGNPSVL